MTIMTRRVTNWRASGACLHADPDLFFRHHQPDGRPARLPRQRQSALPVIRECLEFAYANAPILGIWGGTIPEERQQARRRD